MDNVKIVLLSILYLIANLLLNGVVILKYWQWFFVPLFSLPNINIYYATAFYLLIYHITHKLDKSPKSEEQDSTIIFATKILTVVIILIIGYVLFRLI